MAFSAASVANSFLSRSFGDQNMPGISPMKIQKLLYLAHGYHLAETGQPLLDEFFEAWKFGPVLPSIYHACKHNGSRSINSYIVDNAFGNRPAPIPTEPLANEIIDFVWHEFGQEDAATLSDWTHVRGGPWDKVTESGTSIMRNKDIPNELIENYFKENLYGQEASTSAVA